MGAPVLVGAGIGAVTSLAMGKDPLMGAAMGGLTGGTFGGSGALGSGFTEGGLFSSAIPDAVHCSADDTDPWLPGLGNGRVVFLRAGTGQLDPSGADVCLPPGADHCSVVAVAFTVGGGEGRGVSQADGQSRRCGAGNSRHIS